MTTLTVYDPAMCCATGICGAEVDQKLVNFAADLDWLKSLGVAVTRINISQEPAAFAENAKIKSVLETSGIEGLPVVLIDDDLRSTGRFPVRQELAEMAGVDYAPATVKSADKAQAGSCCSGDDGDEAPSGCC
jgi:hypothetical protein